MKSFWVVRAGLFFLIRSISQISLSLQTSFPRHYDIDDMLSSWELLFDTALDSNCPWRVRRVTKAREPPWLDGSVTKQLRERDRLLKIAKRSQDPADWESYKAARNKAVSLLRRAKSQFFKTTLEHNNNNPKGIWMRPSSRSSVSTGFTF